MPVIEERYDQNKIDGLKRYLKREADKGRSKDFEITVDGFKVVSRTDDVEEFDDYEDEIKATTRNISILIYDGPGTNRNTRYSFVLNQDGSAIPSKPMNGVGSLGEIDEIIQQRLDEKDRDYKITNLEKELAETQQKLTEAEEYHQQLQDEIDRMKVEKPKPSALGITLADFGTTLLDGLLKKNMPQLAGVLNGLMPQQGAAPATEAEGDATFQKQGDGLSPQLTEKQLQYLGNLEAMEEALTPEQMAIAMVIMRTFMNDPDQLITIAQLLNLHNSNEQI
ncbi:MAG: hypothetical protein JSS82_13300 [Bacteroidetes bacterium]|nr:hypothetical protein [Bacteroidota bacterium]